MKKNKRCHMFKEMTYSQPILSTLNKIESTSNHVLMQLPAPNHDTYKISLIPKNHEKDISSSMKTIVQDKIPLGTTSFPMNTKKTTIASVLKTCFQNQSATLRIPLYQISEDLCKILRMNQSSISNFQNVANTQLSFIRSCSHITQKTSSLKVEPNTKLGQKCRIEKTLLSRDDCVVLKSYHEINNIELPTVIKAICLTVEQNETPIFATKYLPYTLDNQNEYTSCMISGNKETKYYFVSNSDCIEYKTNVISLHPAWMEIISWYMVDIQQRLKEDEIPNININRNKIMSFKSILTIYPYICSHFNGYDPVTKQVWCIWVMPHHYSTLFQLINSIDHNICQKLQNSQVVSSKNMSLFGIASNITSSKIVSSHVASIENDIDWPELFIAIFAQVIFCCLAPIKKSNNINHNDLKLDNIVYDRFDQKCLKPGSIYMNFLVYVECKNVWLRFPTYGRFCSFIDFGYAYANVDQYEICSNAPLKYANMVVKNKCTDHAQLGYSILYVLFRIFDACKQPHSTISNINTWNKLQQLTMNLIRRKISSLHSNQSPIFSTWPSYVHDSIYRRVSCECGIDANLDDTQISYNQWIEEMIRVFDQFVIDASEINQMSAMFVSV